MTAEAAVLPRTELIVRHGLIADSDVATVLPSPATKISSQLPAGWSGRRVRMTRIGGTPPIAEHLDRARIQIEAFAPTEDEASLVARTVHAACHRLANFAHSGTGGGVLTGAETVEGLRWFPDTSGGATPVPRFLFVVAFTAHPLPAAT